MNRIKELRENLGLSQEKLAKNLSINLRTLQRWENDETAIRKKNAEKIANYFNVSVPYLLGYTAEIDDSNDWGKIVSISSQDPDYEAVKAGKSIFRFREHCMPQYVFPQRKSFPLPKPSSLPYRNGKLL